MGASECWIALIASWASRPPTIADTGASSVPRPCKNLRRNSELNKEPSSVNSCTFAMAKMVNALRSAALLWASGRRPCCFSKSHSALRHGRTGDTLFFRRRLSRIKGWRGEELARIRGVNFRLYSTISQTFSSSRLRCIDKTDRVEPGLEPIFIGMLDGGALTT